MFIYFLFLVKIYFLFLVNFTLFWCWILVQVSISIKYIYDLQPMRLCDLIKYILSSCCCYSYSIYYCLTLTSHSYLFLIIRHHRKIQVCAACFFVNKFSNDVCILHNLFLSFYAVIPERQIITMLFIQQQRTVAYNVLAYLWNEDAIAIMKLSGLIYQEQNKLFWWFGLL